MPSGEPNDYLYNSVSLFCFTINVKHGHITYFYLCQYYIKYKLLDHDI